MILDKNGKLFGKVSIIDIGLILLIVLVALGTFWRFYGTGKVGKDTSINKVSYVVEIRGVKNIFLDEINVDDLIGSVDTSKQNGKIKSITSVPFKDFIVDVNGIYKESVVPGQCTITLTIEADAVEKDDGLYVNERPIKVSTNMTYFKTKYMQFGGFITGITGL